MHLSVHKAHTRLHKRTKSPGPMSMSPRGQHSQGHRVHQLENRRIRERSHQTGRAHFCLRKSKRIYFNITVKVTHLCLWACVDWGPAGTTPPHGTTPPCGTHAACACNSTRSKRQDVNSTCQYPEQTEASHARGGGGGCRPCVRQHFGGMGQSSALRWPRLALR